MEFSWMKKRSASSLTRAAAKGAGSQGGTTSPWDLHLNWDSTGPSLFYSGATTVPGLPH